MNTIYIDKKNDQCRAIIDDQLIKTVYNKDEILTNPPNILITNYMMLERILLDPRYLSILNNSKVGHIVLDEIHYYRGAQGIDVSLGCLQ